MVEKPIFEASPEDQSRWLDLRHEVRGLMSEAGIFNNPLHPDRVIVKILREYLKLEELPGSEVESFENFRENLVQTIVDAGAEIDGDIFESDDALIRALRELLAGEEATAASYWRSHIGTEIEFYRPELVGRDPELGIIAGVVEGQAVSALNGVQIEDQSGNISTISFEKAVEAIHLK